MPIIRLECLNFLHLVVFFNKEMIMKSRTMGHKISCALFLAAGLFAWSTSNAWHGGGWHGGGGGWHGGGWHGGDWGYGGYYGGYHGGYYGVSGLGGWGWGVPVIGGVYYSDCSIVRQCYSNGTCVRTRVCN